MKNILIISISVVLFTSCSFFPLSQTTESTENTEIGLSTGSGITPSLQGGNESSGAPFSGNLTPYQEGTLPCPNVQTGFKNLDQAILMPIHQNAGFNIFEALCGSQEEQNFANKINHFPASIRSVIVSKPEGKIESLPLYLSISTRFQSSIVSIDFKLYLLGISPKSTADNMIMDILLFDTDKLTSSLVGQISPDNMNGNFEVYPEGIAYIGKENRELHFFTFTDRKDQVIAKNVVEFVANYSDGRSKIFREGWNLLYYSYPEGVGITPEDDTKFQPKWVDVKFYTYNHGENHNTLTLQRKTSLEGGNSDSTIVLDASLIKAIGTHGESLLYFGPNQIQ